MWNKVYDVEDYLAPMAAFLRETFLCHCKKAVRLVRADGKREFWFDVAGEGEDAGGPVIRVDGGTWGREFTFRSSAAGASFSITDKADPEDAFYEFVMRISYWRQSKRLPPFDYDRVYDIDPGAVPPVAAGSYAPLTGMATGRLLGMLDGKFSGFGTRIAGSKYSVVLYARGARITKFLCRKRIPVYEAFLHDFQRLYGFKDAVFVFARRKQEQHVFFYVKENGKGKENGFYHNTQDGSGVFFKETGPWLEALLEGEPDYLFEGKECWEAARSVLEYRRKQNGRVSGSISTACPRS
jgi:hypothetical protein